MKARLILYLVFAVSLIAILGICVYGSWDEWTAPYEFITVDENQMRGKRCGYSTRRAITCEDDRGHIYQVKEYWRIDE